MVAQTTLTRIDDVAAHETLHHYDELPEATKHAFPSLVGDGGGDAAAVADALDDGDVVKFTDYYRVETG